MEFPRAYKESPLYLFYLCAFLFNPFRMNTAEKWAPKVFLLYYYLEGVGEKKL